MYLSPLPATTVEIGASAGVGFGLLETSNTVFTVRNTLAIRATGDVTNHIGSASSGFDITSSAPGALTIDDGASLTIRFAERAAVQPHHGLRWVGDQLAALEALRSAGKLIIDDTGLAKTASVYLQGGDTYVGLPQPGGSLFTIR
jgi:hypothetical protein